MSCVCVFTFSDLGFLSALLLLLFAVFVFFLCVSCFCFSFFPAVRLLAVSTSRSPTTKSVWTATQALAEGPRRRKLAGAGVVARDPKWASSVRSDAYHVTTYTGWSFRLPFLVSVAGAAATGLRPAVLAVALCLDTHPQPASQASRGFLCRARFHVPPLVISALSPLCSLLSSLFVLCVRPRAPPVRCVVLLPTTCPRRAPFFRGDGQGIPRVACDAGVCSDVIIAALDVVAWRTRC